MISSVADQILDFVRTRGSVELNEVMAHIGKDESYTKRILTLLEKEGLITINYKWTKFIVNWAGKQAFVPLKPGYTILGREEVVPEKVEKEIVPREKAKLKEEIKEIKIEKVRPAMEKEEIFQKLRQKIDDIESKRAEIESLQREREHIFEKAIVPLGMRIDAEIGALSECIRERERAIDEARASLQRFREKADVLEVEAQKFELVVEEARRKFESTIAMLDNAISSMKKAQSEIRSELSACSDAIASYRPKFSKISQQISELDGQAIEKSIAQLKRKIESFAGEVATVEEQFAAHKDAMSLYSQRVGNLESKVASLLTTLAEIESKADSAYELQGTIENVRASCARALENFEAEVAKAKKEIERIRSAASARAIAEYLKEIDLIEKKFENELREILKKETELSARIAASKEELRRAIEEMREMSKMLKSKIEGE